nr:hypothetical protein [Tanacetum cinerariifolium]
KWVKYPMILKIHPFLFNHYPLNLRGSTNKGGSKGRKQRVLSLEQNKTNQAAKIKKLKKKVKKLEGKKKKKRTHGLKILHKFGLSARFISSNEEGLGDQEDASKQGRKAKIDADEDLSLINETAQDHGRMNDQDMFGVNDLDGDEVVVDVSAGEKEEQSEKVAKKELVLLI